MAKAQFAKHTDGQIQRDCHYDVNRDRDELTLQSVGNVAACKQETYRNISDDNESIRQPVIDIGSQAQAFHSYTLTNTFLPSKPVGLTIRMMINTANTIASDN